MDGIFETIGIILFILLPTIVSLTISSYLTDYKE
jgi:hypothetical protein